MSEEQKTGPIEKQQLTLDKVTILNLKGSIEKLEQRVLKTEVMLDTLSTGQSVICSALENAGLMKGGEPVQRAWDANKIKWSEAEGARGVYERYPSKDEKAEATDDYKNMLADLKAHDGKMMRNGFFYWIFSDASTVGRKLREKKAKPKAASPDVENVKAKFPSDLAELLSFEVEGEYVVLRPTKFLGSENFAKIASIVREAGGEYISAGKQSRFKVPLER